MAHFIGGVAFFAVAQLGGDHPDAVAGLTAAVAGGVIAALPNYAPTPPQEDTHAKKSSPKSTTSRNHQLSSTPALHTSTDTMSLIQRYIDDLLSTDGSTKTASSTSSDNIVINTTETSTTNVTNADTDGISAHEILRRQFVVRQAMQNTIEFSLYLRKRIHFIISSAISIVLASVAYFVYCTRSSTFFKLPQNIPQFLHGPIATCRYMYNDGLQHIPMALDQKVWRMPDWLLKFGDYTMVNPPKGLAIVAAVLLAIVLFILVWFYFTLNGIKPYVNAMFLDSAYVVQEAVSRNQNMSIQPTIALDRSMSGGDSIPKLASRSWRFFTSRAYRSWLIIIVFWNWVRQLLTQICQFVLITCISPFLPTQTLNSAQILLWSCMRLVKESFDHHVFQHVIKLSKHVDDVTTDLLRGYSLLLSCYMFLFNFVVHQLWRIPVVTTLIYLPTKTLVNGLQAWPRRKLRTVFSLIANLAISYKLLSVPLIDGLKNTLEYVIALVTIIYLFWHYFSNRRLIVTTAADSIANASDDWKALPVGKCHSFLQRILDLSNGIRLKSLVCGIYNRGQRWVPGHVHAAWQTTLDMLPQADSFRNIWWPVMNTTATKSSNGHDVSTEVEDHAPVENQEHRKIDGNDKSGIHLTHSNEEQPGLNKEARTDRFNALLQRLGQTLEGSNSEERNSKYRDDKVALEVDGNFEAPVAVEAETNEKAGRETKAKETGANPTPPMGNRPKTLSNPTSKSKLTRCPLSPFTPGRYGYLSPSFRDTSPLEATFAEYDKVDRAREEETRKRIERDVALTEAAYKKSNALRQSVRNELDILKLKEEIGAMDSMSAALAEEARLANEAAEEKERLAREAAEKAVTEREVVEMTVVDKETAELEAAKRKAAQEEATSPMTSGVRKHSLGKSRNSDDDSDGTPSEYDKKTLKSWRRTPAPPPARTRRNGLEEIIKQGSAVLTPSQDIMVIDGGNMEIQSDPDTNSETHDEKGNIVMSGTDVPSDMLASSNTQSTHDPAVTSATTTNNGKVGSDDEDMEDAPDTYNGNTLVPLPSSVPAAQYPSAPQAKPLFHSPRSLQSTVSTPISTSPFAPPRLSTSILSQSSMSPSDQGLPQGSPDVPCFSQPGSPVFTFPISLTRPNVSDASRLHSDPFDDSNQGQDSQTNGSESIGATQEHAGYDWESELDRMDIGTASTDEGRMEDVEPADENEFNGGEMEDVEPTDKDVFDGAMEEVEPAGEGEYGDGENSDVGIGIDADDEDEEMEEEEKNQDSDSDEGKERWISGNS